MANAYTISEAPAIRPGLRSPANRFREENSEGTDLEYKEEFIMAATKKTSFVKSKVAAIVSRPAAGLGISEGTATCILLSIVTASLYAFIRSRGQAYLLSEQVPWAIICSTCGLFATASIGLFFMAISACVFGSRSMAAFVNRSLFLSIASACATFALVAVNLLVTGPAVQSPWHSLVSQVFAMNFVGHITSADYYSNVWWIRTLMAGTFSCMLIMFWASTSGYTRVASLVGGFGGVLAAGVTMSVGAALVESGIVLHPVWYGDAQLGLYLVCSSFMIGAATLILLTHLSHAIHGTASVMRADTRHSLEMTGKVLMYSTYAVLVATLWRYYSISAAGSLNPGKAAADVMLHGLLSANFWGIEIPMGLVLPVLLLSRTGKNSLSLLSIASVMVIAGAVFQRYDMLLAGRLVPVEVQWQNIAMTFSYLPSLSDLLLVISGIGLVAAILLVGEWIYGKDFRYSAG